MKETSDVKKIMVKKIREVSAECQVSETTASMAVLSANLFMINATLSKLNKNLESLMTSEKEPFLRVAGAIDTYEQN